MTFLRRLVSAIVLAVGLAAGIRLGNRGDIPMQRGGWRPLDLPPEVPPDRGEQEVERV